MAAGLINSFCGKICGTCNFQYSKTTNNYMMSADVAHENQETIKKLFDSAIPPDQKPIELETVIRNSHRLPYQDKKIKIHAIPKPNDEDLETEEMKNKAMITAFKVAKMAIHRFSPAGLNISNKEGLSRLSLAEYLTQVTLKVDCFSLNDKLQKSSYISKKEYDLLQEKIELVRKFGSSVVILWTILKSNGIRDAFDLKRLIKNNLITPGQKKILKEALDQYGTGALLDPPNFAELEVKYKAIFLEAAQKFNPEFLIEQMDVYSPWIIDPSSEISDISQLGLLRRQHSGPARIGLDRLVTEDSERKEFKFESSNEELNHLITRLLVHDAGIPIGHAYGFAILRAQILCHLQDINIKKVVDGDLRRSEIALLERRVGRLIELQGTMQHVFHSIRRTIRLAALRAQHAFPKKAINVYLTENKIHKQFNIDIQNATSMASLSVYALAILYRIADQFPKERIVSLNEKNKIANWFSTERKVTPTERTPNSYATFTQSPNGSSGDPSPADSPRGIPPLYGALPRAHEEMRREPWGRIDIQTVGRETQSHSLSYPKEYENSTRLPLTPFSHSASTPASVQFIFPLSQPAVEQPPLSVPSPRHHLVEHGWPERPRGQSDGSDSNQSQREYEIIPQPLRPSNRQRLPSSAAGVEQEMQRQPLSELEVRANRTPNSQLRLSKSLQTPSEQGGSPQLIIQGGHSPKLGNQGGQSRRLLTEEKGAVRQSPEERARSIESIRPLIEQVVGANRSPQNQGRLILSSQQLVDQPYGPNRSPHDQRRSIQLTHPLTEQAVSPNHSPHHQERLISSHQSFSDQGGLSHRPLLDRPLPPVSPGGSSEPRAFVVQIVRSPDGKPETLTREIPFTTSGQISSSSK